MHLHKTYLLNKNLIVKYDCEEDILLPNSYVFFIVSL